MLQAISSPKMFSKALITGATSGLGEALCEILSSKNIELIQTSRSSDPLKIDLSNDEERQILLKEISEKIPDLIINNAGFGFYGNALDLSIDEQLKMIEVNCKALVEISLHAAKELIKAGKTGTILNISSAGAFFPFPTFNVYCASKAFVNQFSLGLHSELKNKGVRVLCACPGQIATDFRVKAGKGHPQKSDQRSMSEECAAKHLWKQIQREKPLYIFDWRTKAMVQIAKFLPRPLLDSILKKSIQDRFLR